MTVKGPWLGVDYGTARLGLARSDPEGMVATPLEVHFTGGGEADVKYVAELAGSTGAVGIVVGLPSRLDSSESPATQRAAEFARRLKEASPIPVLTWDERLSTVEAEKSLRALGLSRKKRVERTDAAAAALVLQAFLDRRGEERAPSSPKAEDLLPSAHEPVPGEQPASSSREPSRQRVRRRSPWMKVLPVFVVIVGILAFYVLWLLGPPPGAKMDVRFNVPVNATAAVVASALKSQRLIRSATLFRILARLRGEDKDFKAGVHLLKSSLSTPQVMSSLAVGDRLVGDVVLTIPEGYTLVQIAQSLQSSGVTSEQGFLEAAKSANVPTGAVSFPLPQGSLEGYLFPDTYFLQPDSKPEAAVAKMLANFERKVYVPLKTEFASSSLSFNEVVILASMVEREAKLPRERPLIAGVYINRLRKGMKLDCDATIQYALGHHKARLLYSDLTVDSPYNTYVHPGLPPGPICNPGLDSVRAALQPLQSDYLYYVARPDGSHTFSRTMSEHRAAGG